MKNQDLKNKKDTILALIGIIFFIFLAIVARNSVSHDSKVPESTPTPTNKNQEEGENVQQEKNILASLNHKNYHFTYTITENDKIEIMDGKANSNKMKFSIIGNQKEEYAKVSDNYLKLTNGKYEIITNEIRSYFQYITLDSLEDILKQSLVKKEENIQTFTIDTIDLLDKYTQIEYNGFEDFKDNQIKIFKTNEQISKIEIDYSNYFSYITNSTYLFKVTMEFSDFGTIEELEI